MALITAFFAMNVLRTQNASYGLGCFKDVVMGSKISNQLLKRFGKTH